jgi:two-component system, OmpR family, response regulator
MRLLLAEDDPQITAHVADHLEASGFTVDHAGTGPDAWEKGSLGDYAAIILDLGLPGLDGLTLLKRWRREGLDTPVLILTARGSWMERVDGFDAGADDYLPKPFRTEELIARLRALLRRSGGAKPVQQTKSGRLALDPARMTVSLDGEPLSFTRNEFLALSYLMENSDRVVPPMELAIHVQGRDDDAAKNAVEAMIGRIRRKTWPELIETRRGFGYVIGGDAQ